MKKLLSLLKTLSTTLAKSSICTMKKQRNLIFNFTLLTNCLNYPLVYGSPSGHKLSWVPSPATTCRSATRVRKDELLATTLEVKQSREFLSKPLGQRDKMKLSINCKNSKFCLTTVNASLVDIILRAYFLNNI